MRSCKGSFAKKQLKAKQKKNQQWMGWYAKVSSEIVKEQVWKKPTGKEKNVGEIGRIC